MSLVKLISTGLVYSKLRLGHRFRSLDDRTDEEDISGKIVVITGANAGIGKVLCLQMAKRNATVVMACRDLMKAEKVIAEIKQTIPDANLVSFYSYTELFSITGKEVALSEDLFRLILCFCFKCRSW